MAADGRPAAIGQGGELPLAGSLAHIPRLAVDVGRAAAIGGNRRASEHARRFESTPFVSARIYLVRIVILRLLHRHWRALIAAVRPRAATKRRDHRWNAKRAHNILFEISRGSLLDRPAASRPRALVVPTICAYRCPVAARLCRSTAAITFSVLDGLTNHAQFAIDRCKRLGAALAIAALSCALESLASAQQTPNGGAQERAQAPDTRRVVQVCPPGHPIEFVLGVNSLFVELHWLDTYTLAELSRELAPAARRMPSGPGHFSSTSEY